MYLVFDVESKKIFDELNSDDIKDLGISYLGYYRSDTKELDGFFDEDVPKFKDLMDKANLIIGYNIIGFDFPVLRGYFDFKIEKERICDLYKIIYDKYKIHLKLDNISATTLGESKIAHGLDAIRFYREGNFEKLKEYCDMDVKLTKDLYEYILKNGHCFYTDGLGKKVKLDICLPPEKDLPKEIEEIGLF